MENKNKTSILKVILFLIGANLLLGFGYFMGKSNSNVYIMFNYSIDEKKDKYNFESISIENNGNKTLNFSVDLNKQEAKFKLSPKN